jgi:hypothetical protein
MQVVASYACDSVTAAMMASANHACAQDSNLSVPNVTVTAPAALVDRPALYARSLGGPMGEILISGRYCVGEDKFPPCAQASVALSPGAKPTGKPDGGKEGKGVRHRALSDCAWRGSGAAGVQCQLAAYGVEGGAGGPLSPAGLLLAFHPLGREPRRRMIAVTEHRSSRSAVEGN